MSDKDKGAAEGAPKKKGKIGKILVIAVGGVVLIGGGVGAGLYAAGAGVMGGASAHAADEGKHLMKFFLSNRSELGDS